MYRNAAVTPGALATNRTYEFVYDGTYYQLVGDLDANTTYTAATASKDGLMPSADKAKIDLITKPATTGYVIQKDSSGYYVEV